MAQSAIQKPTQTHCPLDDRPHSWISCGNLACRPY